MPRIKLTRNTVLDDGPHEVGYEADVSDRDANLLVAIGKAVRVKAPAKAAAPDPGQTAGVSEAAPPKAPSKMNRAEVDAVVEVEGVDIGDAKTNKEFAAKIVAHRAAKVAE